MVELNGSVAIALLLLLLPPLAGLYIYLRKYRRLIRLTANIPSPPALPVVGHGHHFFGKEPWEFPLVIMDFMDKYGDGETLKVWLGPELNMIFNNVRDVEVVLSSMRFNDKAGEYKTLAPWLREGLLVSRGRKWHKRRKVITPAFHFKILDEYIGVFEAESQKLVANLQRESRMQGAKGVHLYDWVNLCTLDTICETAMGVSINAQTNVDSEYVQAVKTISQVLFKRMFHIFCRFELTYRLTKLARDEKRALRVLHNFTERVIVQRREELLKAAQKPQQTEEDRDIGAKKRMAFLDILLQSEVDGKPLTNLDIREEVDTFMFEGHDTTSSCVTFMFYLLAVNPECQRKCLEEIRTVFGTDVEAPVTYEKLNQLNYVELCIKETLRLYPSVPLLGRMVNEDCEINGKTIPAGTNIGISPLRLGRTPELFPEPELFKPERFDVVTNAERLNPYAFIPFSAGPRNCIGQKFAMLEIKTIVLNVLRHFELEYLGSKDEAPIVVAELILRPRDPLMFRLKPRAM